jgi:hypothetical protein
MKRLIAIVVSSVCFAIGARAAEDNFSRSVPADAFKAAGLGKLSPEELARLDALVAAYKTGALESARREAALAAEARRAAEAAAAKAEATAQAESARAAKAEAEARARVAEAERKKVEADDTSLLKRAKVLLTPGTKIEYSTVEARITGDFDGWRPRQIFTLDNGQRWQVIGGEDYIASKEQSPRVKIVPGALGAFFMHVEGHRQRVKVAILDTAK